MVEMSLLSSGHNSSLEKDIIFAIKEFDIKDDELERAKEFFDFSKELDLDILNTFHYRNIKPRNYCRYSVELFQKLLKIPDTDYTDRYILFLDAIAGNTFGRSISTFFPYTYSSTGDYKRIEHAYRCKYSENDSLSKIYALISQATLESDIPRILVNAAKKDPRLLYKAGKDYCNDKISRAAARLFALAMAFSGDQVFSSDEIEVMENCIKTKTVDLSNKQNNYVEEMVLLMFLTMNKSQVLYGQLAEACRKKYIMFIEQAVKKSSHSYFKENMDSVMRLTGIRSDESNPDNNSDIKFISDRTRAIIKKVVWCAVDSDGFNHPQNSDYAQNSIAFLTFFAKNFPKEYIDVMYCTDESRKSTTLQYLSAFYSSLYEILKKNNPGAITEYNVDFERDIFDLIISREKKICKDYGTEIDDYLRGKTDISSLIYIKDKIYISGYNRYVNDIIDSLKNHPALYSRFIAYKAIQNTFSVRDYVYHQMDNWDDPRKELADFLRILINENIPLPYRFEMYLLIYSYLYIDSRKAAFENAILDLMTENSEKLDDLYSIECPKADVLFRRMYASYLDKTNTNDKNKDRLLTLCSDNSKEVRRTVTEILGRHREYAPDVTGMLSAKKAALRETAVDIISIWGAGEFREALEKAADSEKSAKLADKIRAMLGAAAGENTASQDFTVNSFIEDMHKGGRAKKLSWLYETPLPQVHKKDGTLADDKYMQAMLLAYSAVISPERPAAADRLAAELDEKDLQDFAAQVFSKWYSAGAEAKKKQFMYFAAAYGGSGLVDEMIRCVKDWAENMRGAIAAETIKAVALNGSSQALMAVDNISHKFKHKQVRSAAAEAIGNAAKILGITPEELGDRIVPDLGFDSGKKRVFDYGGRKFDVYLTADLALEVTDEGGKKLKTLPAPGKKDDEEKAKAEYSQFKQLKKQLKNVVAIQSSRLEAALSSDRRWKKAEWEKLFVQNPVMHSFAEGLIWAAYDGGKCDGTFRYMDDGSFSTADSDEYELPEDCTIGLVHPLELDEDTLSAWKEQLSDFEITQPFLQLDRPVYRLKDDEKGKLDVTRFSGKGLGGYTLVGRAEKLGWYKGSVQDGGGFYQFYREDITSKEILPDGTEKLTGCAAEFSFSGLSIGYYEDDITIENLRFYHPGDVARGSYVYDSADDNKAIPLDLVDARYFSEVIYQMEQICK